MTAIPFDFSEINRPSPQPLFDLKFLNDFDNKELKFVLLDTFIRTVPPMCAMLEQTILNNDIVTLNDTAHKLKPNVQMMGIKSIEPFILKLESYKNPMFDESIRVDIYLVTSVLYAVVDDFKQLLLNK